MNPERRAIKEHKESRLAEIPKMRSGYQIPGGKIDKLGKYVVGHPFQKGLFLSSEYEPGSMARRWTHHRPEVFIGEERAALAISFTGSGKILMCSGLSLAGFPVLKDDQLGIPSRGRSL